MSRIKLIAIGDNVADKYLSRGLMYPGGQCLNTCVYAKMNGADTAYLGKFGKDAVAKHNCEVLTAIGIDYSHCRYYEGENGFAEVTLRNNDRVFLGSNKGGVAKSYPFDFVDSDFDYIKNFSLIYTNLNSYIEEDLPVLKKTGVPIVFDFSTKWTDEYLQRVCPYIEIAVLSCAHLSEESRVEEMKKVGDLGVKIVLGTIGENGSYALYDGDYIYQTAVFAENVRDTMGAGDAYFTAFLLSLLEDAAGGSLIIDEHDRMCMRIKKAMKKGAYLAAKVCGIEGAFGYGTPIV